MHKQIRDIIADVLAGTRFPAKQFHDEAVRMVVEIEADMILEALGVERGPRVGHDDGAGGQIVHADGRMESHCRPETFHYLYRIRASETDPVICG